MSVAMRARFTHHRTNVESVSVVLDVDSVKKAAGLLALLGKVVDSAHGNEAGTLSIQFADGQKLEIFDEESYESYEILHGKDWYII